MVSVGLSVSGKGKREKRKNRRIKAPRLHLHPHPHLHHRRQFEACKHTGQMWLKMLKKNATRVSHWWKLRETIIPFVSLLFFCLSQLRLLQSVELIRLSICKMKFVWFIIEFATYFSSDCTGSSFTLFFSLDDFVSLCVECDRSGENQFLARLQVASAK